MEMWPQWNLHSKSRGSCGNVAGKKEAAGFSNRASVCLERTE